MGIRYERRGIVDNAIDSEHYTDGSIDTVHIADNQVTLAKMAGGTDGNIISFDANGDPVAIATGSDGEVLTSAGIGQPPAFEAAAGGASQAVQSAIEGETNQDTYIPPDLIHFAPSAAKFWCKYDNAAGADVSYNVTSVTDTGVGNATVNIATDFSSIHWAGFASADINDKGEYTTIGVSNVVGAITVYHRNFVSGSNFQDPAFADPNGGFVCGFGDHA
jgi:hypothetical protein